MGLEAIIKEIRKKILRSKSLATEARFQLALQVLNDAYFLANELPSTHPFHRLLAAEFERHGIYEKTWSGFALIPPSTSLNIPDWDGSDLAGKRLLIQKRIRDIGSDLRLSRLFEISGRKTEKCHVILDERLVRLFDRSFNYCTFASETTQNHGEYDVLASYETLALHQLRDSETIRQSYIPLVADNGRVLRLRREYTNISGRKKILGLSWYSSNEKKQNPSLQLWCQILKFFDDTWQFVCCDYGDRSEDISFLEGKLGRKISPPLIDQMRSLDDLAAQLSAMNLVLTISNTTAHMAGAVGVQTVLLLGDFTSMTWPYAGETSVWYPYMTIMRSQNGWEDLDNDVLGRFRRFNKGDV